MTRWDVARQDRRCVLCANLIIAGEQFRLYTPKNRPICITCAKSRTHEDPPADMPEQPRVPVLTPPAVWHEPQEPPLMSTRQRRLRARQDRAGW